MKVLFAVSNEEISEAIVKKYQKEYKEIISYKNVYYFNAILKEIQKDKTYDRIVISEELEAFTNTQYDQIDKFIFEKLDSISDEASNSRGDNTPIILICSDRRTKGEDMLVKLFGIGIYDALIGNDRSVDEVCKLIHKPRSKKETKLYYKVESDEVKYQSENENDVSEQEIQNILAHYKKLGRNEEKYVASFNNIVEQYNDAQLRIISKFLPLNVRAVLEEKSPKYQQIMSFNNAVTNSIRKPAKEQDLGPSGKLLRPKNSNNTLTGPVVIPSSVNTNNVRKLARNNYIDNQEEDSMDDDFILPQVDNSSNNEDTINRDIEDMLFNTQEPKRRGRPRKTVTEEPEINLVQEPPKRRGRPRKNPIQEEQFVEEDDTILPGFENINNTVREVEDEPILPGFTNVNSKTQETENKPNKEISFEDPEYDKAILPGFENISTTDEQTDYNHEAILPGFETVKKNYNPSITIPEKPINNVNTSINQPEEKNTYVPQTYDPQEYQTQNYQSVSNDYYQSVVNPVQDNDLSRLLSSEKKIVTFVGTSKNGTSFIVNNLAELLSSIGVNVAILDTTKNRNSYYIYTKNEESLRKTAISSITNLANGVANGIRVNSNLAVYTSLPNEDTGIENVQTVLETLIKSHTVVLIDCDFTTPKGYFSATQDIYLVQTMDVLTIQPLTAFLRDLVAQNILDETKIKVIINKYVRIRNVSEKEIIGGMAYYNDPAMTYQTELFDKSLVKYITIPFEEETYTRYLQGLINCDISLKGYSKVFMQNLKQLSNMIYPNIASKGNYKPPTIKNNGRDSFSNSMNNTLEQMKRNY